MNINRIPEELRNRDCWIRWRNVTRDGNVTKLPYQLNGQLAKSNDPETWAAFADAHAAITSEDAGIGFVFHEEDPYCGIDLDGCRATDGRVVQWARDIIVNLGSYAEVSPSQTGVKIWVRGTWPYQEHKALVDGERVCDKQPAIEVYDRLRYFAVTGQRLQGMERIVEAQDKLDALHARFWPQTPQAKAVRGEWYSDASVVDRARKYVATIPPAISGQGGHPQTFKVACVLVCGFALNESDALALLTEWNAGCQPPWSERELRHKIRSAMKEPGKKGYLRNVAPMNYQSIHVPEYLEPPQLREPDKTTLHAAASGYLESVRIGAVKRIDLGIPDLDYAIGGGAEYGELVLFAGRPSHGKSAVALQMCHHWSANGIPSAFISEEMASLALGKRAIQFLSDVPEERWVIQGDRVAQQIETHFAERATCHVIERCATADVAVATIRNLAKANVRGIVIDYAQLLDAPGRTRLEKVTHTSIALRKVASECAVLLVALCQLNRDIEDRKKFAPRMSDLRESGQLEQDADVIVFGVWPHKVDSSHDPFVYQFYVCKNRNRPVNVAEFQCRFEPSRQRFLDLRDSYRVFEPTAEQLPLAPADETRREDAPF